MRTDQSKRKYEIFCTYCKRLGQKYQTCRQRKERANKRAGQNFRTCKNCGMTNHAIDECYTSRNATYNSRHQGRKRIQSILLKIGTRRENMFRGGEITLKKKRLDGGPHDCESPPKIESPKNVMRIRNCYKKYSTGQKYGLTFFRFLKLL